MFSATRFVVAGAIVALFGGLLLIGQPARPTGDSGAASDGPGVFGPTGSLAQSRVGHTATLLPDGRVLVVGGTAAFERDPIDTAETWDPDTGTFSPAGSLAEPRDGLFTATLLPDGRVLVIGGNVARSAEIWDPETSTFAPAGTPGVPRVDHSATLMPDGRVLVVGGQDISTPMRLDPTGEVLSRTLVDSAEIWDPATSTFSPAGTHAPHYVNTTTVLPDGRVLVVGSSTDRVRLPASMEIWDPATDTFDPAASRALGNGWHTAILLPDGRVLVVDGDGDAFATVWDPATGSFTPSGAHALGYVNSVTPLPDGRVMVVGGDDRRGDDISSAEVWDLTAGEFHDTGSLRAPAMHNYTATALPDGRVLIAGGCIDDHCSGGTLASADIWDPATEAFMPGGSLAQARILHTATLLPDGRVLVIGGAAEGGDGLASAEVWEPSGQ